MADIAVLPASSGSALVGFLQAGTGAVARTTQSKLRDAVSVLDFIPEAEHAGIVALTSTFNTAPAFQAAFDTGKLVHIPSGRYIINSSVNTKRRGFIGAGAEQVTIQAGAAMDYMFLMSGQNTYSRGVFFQGNGLAKSSIRVAGGNGSTLSHSRIEGNLQDGIVFAALLNNSNFSVRECLIRNNGREFTGGTVTAAAAANIVTFTGATNLTTLGLRAGVDYIAFAGITRPFMVTAITSATQLQIYPPLPSALAAATYKILQGNNIYITRYGDNSDIKITNCTLQTAKCAGIMDLPLYGAVVQGSTYEFNGIARVIGLRDPIEPTFGSVDESGYFEEQIYANFIIGCAQGCVITPSAVGTPVHDNHILFDDVNTTTGVTYEYNGRKQVGPKIPFVNEATISLKEGVPAYLTQSAGATNIIANLTHTLNSKRVSEFMDGATPVTFLDIGGKTVTFQTTDGSTVNGIAGTTGVVFSGNYKVVNFKYHTTGWVVW